MRRTRKVTAETETPPGAELDRLLAEQRERFRERFGREMSPNDPLFFDEAAPGSEPKPIDPGEVEKLVVAEMKASGARPELVYAFERTGRLVSEDDLHLFTKVELDEWKAAIAEYHACQARSR